MDDYSEESITFSQGQWLNIIDKYSKTRSILMRVIQERNEFEDILNRIATFANLDWDTERPFPIDKLLDRIYT